jgi:hypothetical protein
MDIFNEFIARIKKNEGLFIFKNQLMDQIRRTNKDRFSVKYEKEKNLIIVAIPIGKDFKI